jgi:hypothetical protein
MKNKLKNNLLLLLITFLAFFLRVYGLNWDQGQHLHPDERMITMVAEKISFPSDLQLLFSPDSPLNPKFFAYGSFPIYLLRLSSYLFSFFDPTFETYLKMNLVGRLLSALFDSFSVILVFVLAQSIFKNKKISLLSALFYALSFFPIQLSHFYAVDTPLNFFILLTLYRTILFYEKTSFKNAFLIGLSLALSLATKISATLLIVSLGTGLFVGFLLSLKKQIFGLEISFLSKTKTYLKRSFLPQYWTKTRLKKLSSTLFFALLISLITFLFFFIFQPFAFFDFALFLKQINEQRAMTRDAFVFPYTLQYVATTPYLYQLKNIFLWGQGPLLSSLSFLGFFYTLFRLVGGLFSPGNEESEGKQLIVFSFFLSYFAVTGTFAVKFMRYCLPLYPFLSIFAAYFLFSLYQKSSGSKLLTVLLTLFSLLHLLYLASFFSIYRSPNTRVQATAWIEKNIPPDSLILREHWDDGLPLGHHPEYNLVELPLYESDLNPQKWPQIDSLLQRGDYLILASNRLYTPLMRLADCPHLPPGRCYSKTAQYYQDLFSGRLNYQKVAEFTSYPSIFGFSINDQSADESFTVYDHPQVTIFKKIIQKSD